MIKELNIIEASNMPVGTEFKVKPSIKNCTAPNMFISEDEGEAILKLKNGDFVLVTESVLTAKFIPIQKPVSFDYAINKGLEGQRIKVDVTKLNEEYTDEYRCVLNSAWKNMYHSIERIFEMLSKATYRKEIITKGKWYIEEY